MTPQRARRSVLLASALALIVGCSGSAPDEALPKPPQEGGATPTGDRGKGNEPTVSELGGARDTLVIAYQSDADTLLSIISQSNADSDIITNIYMPTMDADFDCELTYLPGLFEKWSFSDDFKTLSIKMLEGVQWYDGAPVTSRDLAFTYELVADPVVASPRISYIERMVPGQIPVVLDDSNAEFRYTQAYDQITMTAHTGLDLIPEHVLRDADRATLRGHELAREPLVNGPFKIAEWKGNERIVLEPNDKFTGPESWRPRIKRVVFKVIPEYATRLLELENGQADFMQAILVEDADRLARTNPEIRLYRRGMRTQDYVAWNFLDFADYKAKQKEHGRSLDWATVKPHHIFGDRAVRRALAKGINIDLLIERLLTSKVTGESYGVPAVSTVTPELCKAHNNDIKRLPFDPAAAGAELEAAGWVDRNGDGIREKDGNKLAFTLMTNSGNRRRAKASVIIQANLKDIGAEVSIETVESNTFFERLRKKDYEAALSGWAAALFLNLSTIWHSGERYEFNFVGYNNPEVDRLIQAALNEPDSGKNAELWKQVQAIIYEDQPYAFLYWRDEIVGIHERFKDAKVDLLSPIHRLDTWWVPDDEVKYKR